MSAESVIVVKSPDQFRELLSADLHRVSLLNFWASWAEPCTKMNKLVGELAVTYPKVLTLQVRQGPMERSQLKLAYR
jgi:hypothetical protein